MVDLPSELEKIQQEETEFEGPVSEALAQKIGKDINGLIDGINSFQEFTANGTYAVGANIQKAFLKIIGGGGGGGGGGFSQETGIGPSDAAGGGGGGGEGAVPHVYIVPLVPGEVLNIQIGAGGAAGPGGNSPANGGNGGATIVTGTNFTITVPGGLGGTRGENFNTSGSAFDASLGGPGGNSGAPTLIDHISTPGGNGGDGGNLVPGIANSAPTAGRSSTWNPAGSITTGLNVGRGGAGGSGGSGIDEGGDGGNGGLANVGGGTSGTSGSRGAGGGGGGGGGTINTGAPVGTRFLGGNGGAGGNGSVTIFLA